jgi:maltooligosyltrehalose trehalohydrolase
LKGRQREFAAFGWKLSEIPNPNTPDTFQRSQLIWNELQQTTHREMFDWYRALIELRRGRCFQAALLATPKIRFDEQKNWLVIERGDLVVASNFSSQVQRIPLLSADDRQLLICSRTPTAIGPEFVDATHESVVVLERIAEA